MNVYLHVHLKMHAAILVSGSSFLRSSDTRQFMSQSDAHYTLSVVNHQTGQQIKLELIDPRFLRARIACG
jgi:hypothetical protein